MQVHLDSSVQCDSYTLQWFLGSRTLDTLPARRLTTPRDARSCLDRENAALRQSNSIRSRMIYDTHRRGDIKPRAEC